MNMKMYRAWQGLRMLALGAVLLQAGGCDFTTITTVLQTFFLGVTAAGSYAILQNL